MLPGFNGTTLKTTALLLDRDGGLWVGTTDRGIYHIHGSHVDRFGAEQGLSSNFVLGFFEDREGSVWVATSRGIDSFHESQIITFSTLEGLSTDNVVSVLVSRDDTVWLANGGSLDSIKDGRIASVQSGKGLPGHEVTSLFEDHSGHLWVGVDNDLFMYEHGQFHRVRRKDGSSTRFIVGITEDTQHAIWAEVSGSKRELIRIQDLKVVDEYPEAVIPSARPLAADARGGIWLGLRNGNLARLRSGHIEVFPFPHDGDSDVRQVMIASDGSVYGTTAFGLIAWWNGKSQILTSRNGLPCDGIIGVIQDNQGALWLYTECGLVEVEKAELQRWWADPLTIIASKSFGAFDGVQPGVPDYNPIAKSSDGKLWFANHFVLQSIDPGHLPLNKIPPPVHLEDLVADRKRFSPTEDLRLPPRMLDLQIDYTALSFVNPRKVRFRYKLEGRDAAWQEPGTRRQAFYNDLPPGKYRFRVIACNNDGVWNEQGATLGFSVEPAWYQTVWFKLLVLTFGLGLASLLILFDRQRYATLLRVRFDERLEVRTRLARELHDTLLQTIQGSKLAADVARESLNDPGKMRSTLDRLSQWLDRASAEGRAALESLRGSSTDTEDLPLALRDVAEVCQPGSMQIMSSASGVARPMHSTIRDEVFRIGEEAIRNACAHSGGTSLTVEVDYGKDVTLTIRDDGCGFDPKLVDSGKPGHFGILGMRERASHIGGRLSLNTRVGEGSCLTLIVPGKIIFISPPTRWFVGIFRTGPAKPRRG
jgi:signal transduction histidine kinase/streptogramin lyase